MFPIFLVFCSLGKAVTTAGYRRLLRDDVTFLVGVCSRLPHGTLFFFSLLELVGQLVWLGRMWYWARHRFPVSSPTLFCPHDGVFFIVDLGWGKKAFCWRLGGMVWWSLLLSSSSIFSVLCTGPAGSPLSLVLLSTDLESCGGG